MAHSRAEELEAELLFVVLVLFCFACFGWYHLSSTDKHRVAKVAP